MNLSEWCAVKSDEKRWQTRDAEERLETIEDKDEDECVEQIAKR